MLATVTVIVYILVITYVTQLCKRLQTLCELHLCNF